MPKNATKAHAGPRAGHHTKGHTMHTHQTQFALAALQGYAQAMGLDAPTQVPPAAALLLTIACAHAYARATNDDTPAPPYAMLDCLPGGVEPTQAQEIVWDALVSLADLNA